MDLLASLWFYSLKSCIDDAMRSIITPLVSGIVVLLIGLSLVKVGVVSCGGGYGAMDNGTFGSLEHVGIAAVVMGSVLFFNRCKNKYLRMSSIVLGLCIGYGIALAMGKVDFSQVTSQNIWSFNIPVPFKYGLDFNISSFIAIGFSQKMCFPAFAAATVISL